MWCCVTRYTLPNDQSTKTDLIFIYGSCFGLLGIWKVVFEVYYAVLPPSQGPSTPKVPIWACTPLVSCIASPIWFIFSCFLPFKVFLGTFFGYFWPPSMPTCATKVSIWTLTTNFIIWAWNQQKKKTLIIDYFNLFNFFPICGGFCSFGVQF